MAFKDGDGTGLDNEGSRLLTRRAALAGTAAGAWALVSAGLTGCSAAGADTNSASSADNELTDEQKKVHKQIVATYNVEKQAAIKEQIDADYAAGALQRNRPVCCGRSLWHRYLELLRALCDNGPRDRLPTRSPAEKDWRHTQSCRVFLHAPHSGDAPTTEHEFKVIGLIPNHKNTVTLTCAGQDGASCTSIFTVKTPALKGDEEEHLTVTAGESNTPLADGLFTITGNDSSKLDFMYLYDNAGQIRGEVPIIGYRSHRLLFPGDGSMIMSVSTTKMAQINAIGRW